MVWQLLLPEGQASTPCVWFGVTVRQAREGPRPLYERLGLVQDEEVEESEAKTPSKKDKSPTVSVTGTPVLATAAATGLGQEYAHTGLALQFSAHVHLIVGCIPALSTERHWKRSIESMVDALTAAA
jgi:hypothetical protein